MLIFGGGVYVAKNTSQPAFRASVSECAAAGCNPLLSKNMVFRQAQTGPKPRFLPLPYRNPRMSFDSFSSRLMSRFVTSLEYSSAAAYWFR